MKKIICLLVSLTLIMTGVFCVSASDEGLTKVFDLSIDAAVGTTALTSESLSDETNTFKYGTTSNGGELKIGYTNYTVSERNGIKYIQRKVGTESKSSLSLCTKGTIGGHNIKEADSFTYEAWLRIPKDKAEIPEQRETSGVYMKPIITWFITNNYYALGYDSQMGILYISENKNNVNYSPTTQKETTDAKVDMRNMEDVIDNWFLFTLTKTKGDSGETISVYVNGELKGTFTGAKKNIEWVQIEGTNGSTNVGGAMHADHKMFLGAATATQVKEHYDAEKATYGHTGGTAEATFTGNVAYSEGVTVTGTLTAEAGATLYIAAYDKTTNKLVGVKTVETAGAVNETISVTGRNDDNTYVKAFVWDSNLKPLMLDPVTLTVQ